MQARILVPAALAALVTLGSAAPAAEGQEAVAVKASLSQGTDVIVVVDPLQEDAEPFAPVIADAASLRLQGLGLRTQVDSISPSEDVDPLPRAQRSGAAAVLVCSYRVNGRQMAVTIGWYDVLTHTAAASAQAQGDMDLHLDTVIFGALDDLLGRVQDKVHAIAARQAGLPPGGPSQGQAAPLEPAHPTDNPPAAAAAQPGRGGVRVLLAGGFAPFVPTGAASAYFGLGYLPSVLASVLLPTRAGPIGIGLYAGMDYFAAIGSVDTSSNFLVPVGADLRYEIDLGALRPYFHVTGGPALLVMVTGSQGTLLGLMPFLKSGLGLTYRFGSRIGLALAADYDVYFEMPYLITGFSPSLTMEVLL